MYHFFRYFAAEKVAMGKVNTSYFLARRLRTSQGGRRNSVMVRIATLSVSIGLAVMIIALGVIYGFKYRITGQLTGSMAHVRIAHLELADNPQTDPISADQPFLDLILEIPGFAAMHRYVQTPGILRGEDSFQGILLKGVGAEFDWAFFRDALVAGDLPVVSDSTRNRDILISQRLAERMQLSVGDRIELMFLQQPPRRDQYKISGIYATEMPDIDNALLLTDIRNVQRLNKWEAGEISGYEITTSDFGQISSFSHTLFERLVQLNDPRLNELVVTDLKESHPLIFDWLATHNLNALIVIVVMLLVAVFNMIAAMLIILLEKTSLIGILKALGMDNSAIQRIFIYRSAHIALRGMIWGNLFGLAFCYIQQYTGLLKLNADGYFLTVVPIHIDGAIIALLNIGVFAVIVLMQVLPTRIVARVEPEKTIRFDG
ncbi:MAG: ABC transporter permease [Rikenellaceae bacterium]|nr:ABC transporter permease [Rikenellaceae bacterium]